jgi:putative tributyrin esterase
MAIMRLNFYAQTLGMQTNVLLHIPSFNQDSELTKSIADLYPPNLKFQTLWLLHGGSDDDSLFQNCTNVMRYASANKLAVVIPCDYNASYMDVAGGALYFTYIAEELRDYLITHFPLSDRREDNFVAGNSMGGIGATRLALVYPERFAVAMALSGGGVRRPADNPDKSQEGMFLARIRALGWPMPDLRRDAYGENHDLLMQAVAAGKTLPRFIISCGEQDDIAYQSNLSAAQYMPAFGVDVFSEFLPGYKHEWDFWDLALRRAIYEWLPLKRAPVVIE